MQLYTLPGSPNSRKVVAVIRHLGLSIEIRHLDFARGETKTPVFLSLNPNGMVPVAGRRRFFALGIERHLRLSCRHGRRLAALSARS